MQQAVDLYIGLVGKILASLLSLIAKVEIVL